MPPHPHHRGRCRVRPPHRSHQGDGIRHLLREDRGRDGGPRRGGGGAPQRLGYGQVPGEGRDGKLPHDLYRRYSGGGEEEAAILEIFLVPMYNFLLPLFLLHATLISVIMLLIPLYLF
ncbi:MAG: hypothetical protein METHAR1v1_950023 [Methanothrix sp.]|nr:MAG: hypothetical protein METHAR1v1_950023 [Methanothrix sp.]